MSDPTRIEAPRLFEFIGNSGLAAILVSAHPIHTFNPHLAHQLVADHKQISLGVVDLRELILMNTDALRYLHQGLRHCGAPSDWGVLPGYCLFRNGEMLVWDLGLPTFNDLEAIARSALVGVVFWGVSQDKSFIGQALRTAAEQVSGYRVAARFRQAVSDRHSENESADDRPAGARPADDLYWAYQVLGVLPTASDHEIHQAWRRRRTEHHPDTVATDPAEFERRSRLSADINRARDIIVGYRSGRTRQSSYARAS